MCSYSTIKNRAGSMSDFKVHVILSKKGMVYVGILNHKVYRIQSALPKLELLFEINNTDH